MSDDRKILLELRRLNTTFEQFVECYSFKMESELGMKRIEMDNKAEIAKLGDGDLNELINLSKTYKGFSLTKTDRYEVRALLDKIINKRSGLQ